MRQGFAKIGYTGSAYFIADIAANHDGDIRRAFKLIELAKEAGADAAKFQNFTAERIVSRRGFDTMPKAAHQAAWTKSVYEVYKDASIDQSWTRRLKEKCGEVGIAYLTSAYDPASVDAVDPYLDAYKIGSGDITWPFILEYIAKKGKPVLLATGASDIADVARAYNILRPLCNDICLMQCNTNYTASEDNFRYINLRVLNTYRVMFPDCVLGLSDHTFGHATVLGALALGAKIFEKHFTDDNGRAGPDHRFSMNPATWKEMVTAAKQLEQALGDGVKRIEDNEIQSAVVQRRALYLTRGMRAGEAIRAEDLKAVRPIREGAVPPYREDEVIGKTLRQDMQADSFLRLEDIR
ncbi:MAG: N-acetylneuraminate synthase family protein [Bacillota bacterium]